MSRSARLLAIALLVSFALGTAACGDLTAPQADSCSILTSGTCVEASILTSGT